MQHSSLGISLFFGVERLDSAKEKLDSYRLALLGVSE